MSLFDDKFYQLDNLSIKIFFSFQGNTHKYKNFPLVSGISIGGLEFESPLDEKAIEQIESISVHLLSAGKWKEYEVIPEEISSKGGLKFRLSESDFSSFKTDFLMSRV